MGVGLEDGRVVVEDVEKKKRVLTSPLDYHLQRVCSLAFNSGDLLSTGSRDKAIHTLDLRTGKKALFLAGHRQEVCGLKWSPYSTDYLASGSNDNQLKVWSAKMSRQYAVNTAHQAAVKAIDWDPYNYNQVVSGGGSQDKQLIIYNYQKDQVVHKEKTPS